MANNLTGDYEAVVQVSVRQINGLLATLHQNGAKGGPSPSFPHGVTNVRVGGLPKYLEYELFQFGEWLGSAVQSFQGAGGAVSGADLAVKAPPGVSGRFQAAVRDIASARAEVVTAGSVRGRAEVQVSTPAISLVRSEVVVHVYVRAHYLAEAGTPLPEPIHGEVRVSYVLVPKTAGGKNSVEVRVPSDDSKIRFFPAPGSGLSQADADAKIAVHVRKAIRERFAAAPVDLPAEFKFVEYKGLGGFGNLHDPHYVDALGTGSDQALALPVQLSDNPAPPGALDGVTNLFLGTGSGQSDFAIAVSREYVQTKFEPTLDRLRAFARDVVAQIDYLPDPTYRLSVTSVGLQFGSGAIDLIIHAKATTSNYVVWPAKYPDYNNIVITQRLRIVVGAMLIGTAGGPNKLLNIILTASDTDLSVTGITGLYSGAVTERARKEIIAERDKALPAAQTEVGTVFQDALTGFNEALRRLDPFASATYTAVEITPDGILVRGAIDTKHRHPPEMEIGYTQDGNSFSALNCWIPGGRIANHTWYWVETETFKGSNGLAWTIPWWGKPKSASQPHRFTFPIPAAIKGQPGWSKQVCLSVDGGQVTKDGGVVSVTGFEESGSCEVTSHEPVLVVPPWWEAVYGVFWLPRWPELHDTLEESIAGHINVLAHARPAGGLTTNALVHFVGSGSARPLEALGQALAAVRRKASLIVVLVMPAGAFHNRTGEIEQTLGLRRERPAAGAADEDQRFSPPLLITEDYGGGWTRTFAAQTRPSTYLMNARGEFVWKQEEGPDAEALAAAMDEHFLPAPAPRARPLRLAVRAGERAPDARFGEDQVVALNRLRGRQVLLNFWLSWSAPCVRELRRLQRLHDATGGRGPVILAVNGGEEQAVLAEVRRQHDLAFPLIPDPGQRIARLYGVACWPTTVSINPDGVVDRIQFGAPHPPRAEDRGEQAP